VAQRDTRDTAHRAASLTARELTSWQPRTGSADSDLVDELGTLVSRSRDLARNHGVAYIAARSDWKVRLQGGAIIPVFPGDKVSAFTPSRPNSGYGQFVENVLRHIGTGLNIPFELLMKDFSKTNYSSARAALMEAWRYFMGRRQWLATYWARPVYELWLEEAINKGLIEAPNFYGNKALWTRCKWIGPGRGWIDPVKEAKASQLRLETGLSTLEDECATQGLDWEEVLEQRAREQSKMRELGLSIQPIMPEPGTDPSNGQLNTEPDHLPDETNTQTNTPV